MKERTASFGAAVAMLLALVLLFAVAALAIADGEQQTVDRRITICHVPPGNLDNPLTLEVDVEGWNGHRDHPYDYVGECQTTTTSTVTTTGVSSTTGLSTTVPSTTVPPSTSTATVSTVVPATTVAPATTAVVDADKGDRLADTGFGELGRFLATVGLVLTVGGLAGLRCRRCRSGNDDTDSLEV